MPPRRHWKIYHNQIGAIRTEIISQFGNRSFDLPRQLGGLVVDEARRDAGDHMLERGAAAQRPCARTQLQTEADQNSNQNNRRGIEKNPELACLVTGGKLTFEHARA